MAGAESGFAGLRRRMREARERDPALFRLRWMLGVALTVTLVIVVSGNPADGVPERLAEGKTLRGVDYWRTYGWWVALANSVLLAGLLATARRWFTNEEAPAKPDLASPGRPGRWFVVLVLAAVVTGGALSFQRLGQSFWDDEEYNVSRSIDGAYVVSGSGEVEFKEARWRDALWYYYIPNNHVAHTVLSRLSLGAWRVAARPDTQIVSERAVRLPAYLAGLASIASIGVLLWRLGHPLAGTIAAWLLALHPWHIRYGSEARGYSMMLLLLSASLTLLVRALHRGSWGRWAAFGAAQFLLLWTYVGLVLHLVVVNLVALAAIIHLHRRTPALRPQLVRWTAANGFGAMLWLQLMIPNLCQVPAYMARGGRDLGERWIAAAMSHLYAGMPWSHGAFGENPVYPELADAAAAAPLVVWGLLAVAVLAILAGVARLVSQGGVRAMLALVFVLPGPATYAMGVIQEANLYVWYLVFVLPSLALLVGLGLVTLAPPRLARGALTAAVAVAFVGAYLWLTTPARTALLERSFKPARESVLLTRPTIDPAAPANREIVTAHYRDFTPLYYDPGMLRVESVDRLRRLMRHVDDEGLELYMNFGRRRRLGKREPEMLALIENPVFFEKVAELHGFEPPWTRHVFRYRPAAER